MRSLCRLSSGFLSLFILFGGVAQLGEHLLHTQGVTGSSPAVSTTTSRQATQTPGHAKRGPFVLRRWRSFSAKKHGCALEKKHSLVPRSVFPLRLPTTFLRFYVSIANSKFARYLRITLWHLLSILYHSSKKALQSVFYYPFARDFDVITHLTTF